MSRKIIGKMAIKYNEEIVCSGSSYIEIDGDNEVATDPKCIVAFLSQAILPTVFITSQNTTGMIIASTSNMQWKQDYSDPDTPPSPTARKIYQPKIAHITAENAFILTMLDIDEMGIDIATEQPMLPYAYKAVDIEIMSFTDKTEVLTMLQGFISPDEINFDEMEDLYRLIKPFLPKSLPALDSKGYQLATDDGNTITLHGKAVAYINVQT